MRRALLALIVPVSLLALGGSAAAGRLAVAERVAVSADEVTLADLVPAAPAAWARVALGRAPRPGGQRVLAREWVLARAREAGAADLLSVPESVVLTRGAATVDRGAVVQAVEEALAPRLAPGRSLKVASVGLPGPVPEGEIGFSVVEPEGDLDGPTTVAVDVTSDGRRVGRAWVRVELVSASTVLVLSRSVRRGEVLAASDLELRSPKGAARGRALTDPAEAVGKRLTRAISQGQPVLASDVETAPAVQKGDAVRLVARVGGVTASAPGRTLEEGRVGEGVRVENLASGRVVQGTLRDRGVVDVAAE